MFEERSVLPGGEIVELKLRHGMHYSLSVLKGRQPLVAYRGDGGKHRRSLRGRESAYQFKSVEKLRYDFERDAEDALRQG